MTRESDFKYSEHFVENFSSARKIVPIVLDLIGTPKSVVDLGGGTGAWCTVFKECGVSTVTCIDDARIQPQDLLVEPQEFIGCDFSAALPAAVRSDLALSLEVAEHLKEEMADAIVRFLTESSDVVLFSGAIPGQPNRSHVNEKPPLFWKRLFEQRGFSRLDVVRPKIIADTTISYWYRQNLFLFANSRGLSRLKETHSAFETIPEDFELVHTGILERYRAGLHPPSARRAFRELVMAIGRLLRRRGFGPKDDI